MLLLTTLLACTSRPLVEAPAKPVDLNKASIALVVDTSSSMEGPLNGQSKMSLAKNNLNALLDGYQTYEQANPGTLEVGLIDFSSAAREVVPLGLFDHRRLRDGVGTLSANGGTAIGEGLLVAEGSLDKNATGRKNIVLLTDGQNTNGISPEAALEQINGLNESRQDWKTGVHIIAFDTDPTYFSPLKEHGAAVYVASDARELESVLRNTREMLLESY